MTKHPVLFIQGAGDMWAPEGSGVFAKYLEKALGAGFDVIAPEMPDADSEPHYLPWRDRIDAELRAIDEPVILVGHSFGGSVLLKYLAEGPPPVSITGFFLVSVPWWGPEGWAYDEYALPDDFASRLPEIPPFLYHSREDPHVPFAHLALYEERLPNATSRSIDGSQHSFTDLPVLISDIRQLELSRR
jgi:predicted alpha/beta hydrolase family esterase